MKRDITFDICRALCILWIVCVWHLRDYVLFTIPYKIAGGMEDMTIAVLVTFTFISGFFLRRYIIICPHNVLSFYKARVKRFLVLFYVAFVVTNVVYYFFHLPYVPGIKDAVMAVSGLSMFFGPMPLTFWYMCMLMVFYFLTPLFLVWKTQRARLVVMLAIYAFFFFCYFKGHLELRVLYYFPMYCLGILCPGELIVWEKKHSALVIPLSLIVLAVFRFLLGMTVPYLFVLLPMGFAFLFAVSNLIAHFSIGRTLGEWVSYASLNMYLFHRLYFFLVVLIYDHHPYNGVEHVIPLPMALFVYSPLLIISCYYLQKLYNTHVLAWLHWLRYMKYARMVRQRLRDIREAARQRIG